MKLQSLAVIFVIIILPMSIILSAYTHNQIKTLNLQTSYDSKLSTATYDAVKAFQINTLNDSTSDVTTSKMRDIEASVETFFNSVSENFQISEGNKESIKYYVPALVYTMYDGFYVYSPYNNITNPTKDDTNFRLKSSVTYQDETQAKKIYGLKPYIYYSCRYKKGNSDFVITYSLDNYIVIQGTVNGENWDIGGYLLDGVKKNGDNITYNDIEISKSNNISEFVNKEYSSDSVSPPLPYIEDNGTKYYYDANNNQIFSIISGEKKLVTSYNLKESYKNRINSNSNAYNYYKLAYEFTKKVKTALSGLTPEYAVDENGIKISTYYNTLSDEQKQKNAYLGTFTSSTPIFGGNGLIEESDSNFNEHRTAVIRYAIQKNLSVAITNFNNYSIQATSTYEFQMPELSETDWYSIINNISVMSFLQGLPIGGKIYNGYSVVTNNKNKELVSEESIYITTKVGNNKEYHRINANHELNNIEQGIYNIDFERRSFIDPQTLQTKYYYPQQHTACYECVVNPSGVGENDTDILKYVRENLASASATPLQKAIAKQYYTALGRERYGMNRTSYEIYANNLQNDGTWKYCF